MWTRRRLLQAGGAMAVGALAPRSGWSQSADPDPLESGESRTLALRAIDVARRAGASYADVRLTREHSRSPMLSIEGEPALSEFERLHVGVRALVGNVWGFAASSVWTPAEMTRLGQEAVAQARIRASRTILPVDLGVAPGVRDGQWTTPIARDPFTVPVDEIFDTMRGLALFTGFTPGAKLMMQCTFARGDTTFASTDGASFTQTTYFTSAQLTGLYGSQAKRISATGKIGLGGGAGWEYIAEAPLRDMVTRLLDDMARDATLPVKIADVGRYAVVFDAETMARLIDGSIGSATDLDRAVGDEANASGTSYLHDPLAMLGTFVTGSDALTVGANRSMPRGAATVRWDDEGVEPEDFTLVQNGVVSDFQTTRESSRWLAPYYERVGRPVRSHGCARGASGLYLPLGAVPNLVMAPSPSAATLDDLTRALGQGIVMTEGVLLMDPQALNGMGFGTAYEVRQGKRTARLANVSFGVRAPDLWKTLRAVGDATTARDIQLPCYKGEPGQGTTHTVRAVPGLCSSVPIFDASRRS